MKHFLLFFSLFISIVYTYAEGTRELRPTSGSYGNLHFNNDASISGTGIPMYTMFGMYDAPESQQIKIRINSTNETIYYGMNNKVANGGSAFIANVPYRIRDPLGDIVVDNVTMPALGQEGNIGTWSQAVNGPRELGNPAGYDALEYNPTMTGDYVIEFNPSGAMDIHLFDITVVNAAMEPQAGRLHSQGWQISTEGGSNPFIGKVYPYDPRGVVYEVDFNDMQPFTFVVNFNSSGTGATGDYMQDRKSKIGKNNYSIPEFEVFLNPPDKSSFPTFTQQGHIFGEAVFNSCGENSYCLNYTSDVAGILDGYIDVNKNGVYDPATDVSFSKEFVKDTTICIPWDGNDLKGDKVDPANVKIYASFGLSVTHLPVFDAEHNRQGLMVKIVSPDNLPEPLIYWDDSNINDNKNIDQKVNLTGCSSLGGGCHKWQNRGDNANPETINTWWYTKVLFDTITLSSVYNPQVSLSFDEHAISHSDTSLCRGDSLSVFIYDDGEHYNAALFHYAWAIDGVPLILPGERQLKERIDDDTRISVVSTLVSDPTCVTYDTVTVSAQAPVSIDAVVTDDDCAGGQGAIAVQLLSGPPNVLIEWGDSPDDLMIRSGLYAGQYTLRIADPDYSPLCALDTVFVISQANSIEISQLDISPSDCYRANGAASVRMNYPALTYSYSWSGSPADAASVTGLDAGSHTITVTEITYGCTVDSTFMIPSSSFGISFATQDDTCGLGEGNTRLTTPGKSFFRISFDGLVQSDTLFTGLNQGDYPLSVVSLLDHTCRVDTMVSVGDQFVDPKPDIDVSPATCGAPTGSVHVFMPPDGRDYQFSWLGAPFGDDAFLDNLSQGDYTLSIVTVGGSCRLDTSFVIDGTDAIEIDRIDTQNSWCYEAGGSAEATMKDPTKTYSYQWGDRPATTFSRQDGLVEGVYRLIVMEDLTGCADDTLFVIGADPFSADIHSTGELCNGSDATVEITVPSASFTIYWDGVPSRQFVRNGLSAGTYHVRIVSDFAPGCLLDTSFAIVNTDRNVTVGEVSVTDSDCFSHTGVIDIGAIPSANYEYSLNGGNYGIFPRFTGLSPETHHVRIREMNTNCQTDTNIAVGAELFTIEADIEPAICSSANGGITIPFTIDNVEIRWSDGFSGSTRHNLPEGTYGVVARHPEIPICSLDTVFEVPARAYAVLTDISFSSSYDMNTTFPVDFFNNTEDEIRVSQWDFGDSQHSDLPNPSHVYAEEGDYLVTLFVQDRFGCEGTAAKWLSIKKYIPCEVVLPNAFSPNNDQYNDEIGLLGFALEVDLKIFNRWGEVIFRSDDFEKRWDGTYLRAESPIGVYPYVLEYECEDFSGQTIKNKTIGEITLIR